MFGRALYAIRQGQIININAEGEGGNSVIKLLLHAYQRQFPIDQ